MGSIGVGDAAAAVVYTCTTVPITSTAIFSQTGARCLVSKVGSTSVGGGGKATAVSQTQEIDIGKESSEGGLWHVGRGDWK